MNTTIDELVFTAVFSTDAQEKKQVREAIRKTAKEQGIILSSIHNLYRAIGKGEVTGFTVPAINIRALTYDAARIIFALMMEKKVGPVIFEIARSEIEYTHQRPDEYAVVVLAAAIKEGYKGPVFVQGDHFQLSKNKFSKEPEMEIGRIKDLIKEAIEAGFYNIDIDASTLVDLEKADLHEQQKNNYEVTAQMTAYIRALEDGRTISIGGEIGHIGGKNSTVGDFTAFMDGYKKLVTGEGISKVSVQTGTSHGGMPLPDGTIAQVKLDFSVLREVGKVARETYGLGGAVQHGASTLPNELFGQFPENSTLEIHLATGFQNIVYDNMPEKLREEMHQWTKEHCKDEWEEGWSEEQFVYKLRKKALGPFKEKLWNLEETEKEPMRKALFYQIGFLFEKLRIENTREVLEKYVY